MLYVKWHPIECQQNATVYLGKIFIVARRRLVHPDRLCYNLERVVHISFAIVTSVISSYDFQPIAHGNHLPRLGSHHLWVFERAAFHSFSTMQHGYCLSRARRSSTSLSACNKKEEMKSFPCDQNNNVPHISYRFNDKQKPEPTAHT